MGQNSGPNSDNELLRIVRHDFKTPLTSLRMLAQMLQMGAEKGTLATQGERTERNCRMIIEQVDKLVTLSDLFSDIALLIAGKLQIHRQPSDLRAIVREVVSAAGEKVKALQLPDAPVLGQWDTTYLQKALRYLIATANKAEVALTKSDDGHVDLSIKGEFAAHEKSEPIEFFAKNVVAAHNGTMDGHYQLSFA